MALQRSDKIFGSRSGIFPRSSNGFSKSFLTIITKFSGFILKPNSSSLVFTKTKENRGSTFLFLRSLFCCNSLNVFFSSSVRYSLMTSQALTTVTFFGIFDKIQSLNSKQHLFTTVKTVSSIINRTAVKNLLSLPKSYVIFEVYCILNHPFPTIEKLFLITLINSSIQFPFRQYTIWVMEFSCLCLNSSRTSCFFKFKSNIFICKTSLHFTRMSWRAFTTSVFMKREWKQKFLKVSSKSFASYKMGGFLPYITMSLFSAPV